MGDSQNYNSMDLKSLRKEEKKLKKLTEPDKAKSLAKKKQINDNINRLKLTIAELAWKLDEISRENQKHRALQKNAKDSLDNSTSTLKELQREQGQATSVLRQGGLKRIRRPAETKKQIEDEIEECNYQLKYGDVKANQEKKLIRDIKLLKEELKKVVEYMEQNVEEVYAERDVKRKAVDTYKKEHDQVFEKYKEVKQAADNCWDNMQANKNEQTELKEQVKKLSAQKNKVDQDFNDAVQAYQRAQRNLQIIRARIHALENDQASENDQKQANVAAKKDGEAAKERQREREEAEERRKEEAAKRQEAVNERRRLAEEEFKRCQALMRSQRQAPEMQSMGESPDVPVKDDVHAEEKSICRRLIALCEQMKPSEGSPAKAGKKKKRKRKKKRKLQHKPATFTNFSRVGVDIPMVDTDLDVTIKALQDRIQSYDVELSSDVKEESV